MSRLSRALADTASRLLFRDAAVGAVVDHGAHFRSVEFTGDAVKGLTWSVGDKVQVRVAGEGLVMRTYTPTAWDAERGTVTFLAYLHGTGPGSAWMSAAASGQAVQFFGPRRSLKLDDVTSPVVFVGDETSFALVGAWRAQYPGRPPLASLFEVTDPGGCQPALDLIGSAGAHLVRRTSAGTHVPELTEALVEVLRASPAATLCLTGKAQTIAAIRRSLKGATAADQPTRVKAYWDENRAGLD